MAGQCDTEIEMDVRGSVHCIRERGHGGPHAAGVSLVSPAVCGRPDPGSSRVCLRMPHGQWPDAHDFGADDEGMSEAPSWWETSWGPWPGGPVGTTPGMPRWFYTAARPSDDMESVANRQDVEDVKARRHTGGGHGYGQGEDHVSAGDVRAQIGAAMSQLMESVLRNQNSTEEAQEAIGALFQIRSELLTATPRLARLVAGGEDGGTLSAMSHYAVLASDEAGLAAEGLAMAAEDASQELEAAARSADTCRNAHALAVNGVQLAATGVERAANLITEALEELERAIAQTQRTKGEIEQAAPHAHSALERAGAYLGRL